MRRINRYLWILLFAGLTGSLDAQVRKFPYQARVVVDQVHVHSGGGEDFYATQSLQKDAVVTVLRHDPGGWYMIQPPSGSFSWIKQKFVNKTSGSEGEVVGSDAVVFVGSEFGDEITVWQRKLNAGDKVKILGQREIDTLAGPQQMYRIAPPAREYRWIQGASLVPVDAKIRQQHDSDPWRLPSSIGSDQRSPQLRSSGQPSQGGDTTMPVQPSRQLVRLQQIRSEQRQLRDIDERFRSMILGDQSGWDLNAIEADYRALQNEATYRPLSGQIDLRYPAIDRYRQRKAEIEDFKRLTSQTEKRDAELLAKRDEARSMTASFAGFDGSLQLDGLAAADEWTTEASNPFAEFEMNASMTTPSAPATTAQASQTINIPAGSRYIGAGILTRSDAQNGSSGYVLTNSAGKILAHVAPSGSDINLDSHVGQQVGLHGTRYFKDDIKSDYIEVSGLEQVRLR
jgi:hypothetical protein